MYSVGKTHATKCNELAKGECNKRASLCSETLAAPASLACWYLILVEEYDETTNSEWKSGKNAGRPDDGQSHVKAKRMQ